MDEKESRVELWIKKYHHRLELIRTVVPLCLLFLQILIAIKLFNIDVDISQMWKSFEFL